MIEIGFHTDAFNSAYWNFDQCLEWAHRNGVHYIECGAIDGVSWIHGLGYQPHVALWEDPVLLRRKMDRLGIRFSQIDAAFPLSCPKAPRWAWSTCCTPSAGPSWRAARASTRRTTATPGGHDRPRSHGADARIYQQIVPVAEAYEIIINIEPHGYFTTKPDFMAEMLAFADSPYLRMNMDTGNTFIAGQDPVAFLRAIYPQGEPRPIKDVSAMPGRRRRGAN